MAEQDDHLKQAAAATYRRIDRDLERASLRAGRVLRLVRDNLFDPRLNVARVRGTLGLKSNDVTTRFKRVIGEPIKRYIVSRRLEVKRLLGQYFGHKAVQAADHAWDDRGLTDEDMDAWLHE